MENEIIIELPKLGESILTATVVQWFKKEGDYVLLDEPLLEVSTDKVNSEIPAPASGRITKILVQAEQELDVGAPLASLAIEEPGQNASTLEKSVENKADATPSVSTKPTKNIFFSPAVLKIAKNKNISMSELEKVTPSGSSSRVTRKDLEKYLSEKEKAPKTQKPCPLSSTNPSIVRVKMSGMRKAIAQKMVQSFNEVPHATLITEVDVTDVMDLLKNEKEAFLKKNGFKVSITSFIAKAIADAVEEFPLINSSLEEDTICVKKFVNLGIAVSVEQGILVPVISNAHTLSITDIAEKVATFSSKARSGGLQPNDVQDGTITMTNFGMSGTLIGIPIIPDPQVAIVGVGAIKKKVVVLKNDSMAVRSMMHLSLTFDHRVLDGMYGCGYLDAIKAHLETNVSIV